MLLMVPTVEALKVNLQDGTDIYPTISDFQAIDGLFYWTSP